MYMYISNNKKRKLTVPPLQMEAHSWACLLHSWPLLHRHGACPPLWQIHFENRVTTQQSSSWWNGFVFISTSKIQGRIDAFRVDLLLLSLSSSSSFSSVVIVLVAGRSTLMVVSRSAVVTKRRGLFYFYLRHRFQRGAKKRKILRNIRWDHHNMI